MNKKYIKLLLLTVMCLTTFVNLGINIYLLNQHDKSENEVFNLTAKSILELKAETDSVGESYGTAEIISSDGTLVTNAHVVTYKKLGELFAFEKISVRFCDEEIYHQVELVKYDLDLDLAILKLTNIEHKITALQIGDDTKLKTGDKVYAVGNMSNYGLSMTTGSIAIPNVNISYEEKIRKVIQCDLTISDGNSGGALLDKNGRLIGITTFRLKDNSNNIIYGISYCIPTSAVMEYMKN